MFSESGGDNVAATFSPELSDLTPHVGANLDVMHADTTRMRSTPKGLRPFVMTNLKTQSGLGEVVSFIETKGTLVG